MPYMVGNIFERDHQYWPSQSDSGETFTDVTLATLMQMAWRVREWTVTAGSFSFSGINPFTTVPWSMSGSWDEFLVTIKKQGPTFPDDGIYVDVVDEREILGRSDGSFLSPAPHTLLNAGTFGVTELNGGVYMEPSPGTPGAIPVSIVRANLLGDIAVLFNAATREFNTQNGFVSYFFASQPAAPRAEVTVELVETGSAFRLFNSQIDPIDPIVTCGLEVIGRHTASPSPNEGTGTVSDITITATRWWPYRNSLGQPVYDESTGAQIADPFA